MKFVKSSGNVFSDLGIKDAKEHALRAKLAVRLLRKIEESGLSQTKIVEILGITRTDLSKIKNAKLKDFHSSNLIDLIDKISK